MSDTKVKSPKKVFVCFSGGIDSTCLIQYYLDLDFKVCCFHFDYGQPSFHAEKHATDLLAHKLGIVVKHKILRPKIFTTNLQNRELLGRNALFILSVLNLVEIEGDLISLGIHDGTPFYDCSARFVDDIQSVLDGYSGGTIVFDAPFKTYSKQDVINFGKEQKVPFELTYSCEAGTLPPCGKCPSCTERLSYGL